MNPLVKCIGSFPTFQLVQQKLPNRILKERSLDVVVPIIMDMPVDTKENLWNLLLQGIADGEVDKVGRYAEQLALIEKQKKVILPCITAQ